VSPGGSEKDLQKILKRGREREREEEREKKKKKGKKEIRKGILYEIFCCCNGIVETTMPGEIVSKDNI